MLCAGRSEGGTLGSGCRVQKSVLIGVGGSHDPRCVEWNPASASPVQAGGGRAAQVCAAPLEGAGGKPRRARAPLSDSVCSVSTTFSKVTHLVCFFIFLEAGPSFTVITNTEENQGCTCSLTLRRQRIPHKGAQLVTIVQREDTNNYLHQQDLRSYTHRRTHAELTSYVVSGCIKFCCYCCMNYVLLERC